MFSYKGKGLRSFVVGLLVTTQFAGVGYAQVASTGSSATSTLAPSTEPRPVAPLYGNIRSFWGNIRSFDNGVSPYWGNIRSFQGDATPFWGNIRSFWGTDLSPYEGDLSPFWGNIRSFEGDGVAPSWGNIRSFWGDISPQWGNIRSFWGNIRSFNEDPASYQQLAQQLNGLVTSSEATLGAAVTQRTGKSFAEGFAQPLLAKYGVDLSNPASLEALPDAGRTLFFLDWYDQLMEYSGKDHVDWWMKAVNWTPAVTQQQGMGRDTVIGLLDLTVTGDADILNNITRYSGTSNFSNGHGAAVASLMVSAHDGRGVMGIAPSASVVAYNPFDSSGTAGWADVKTGVLTLGQQGASIINMSLGVPGSTFDVGWKSVLLDPTVLAATKNTVFVVAAGNDGLSQSTNIPWDPGKNVDLIVVGSVDPTGTISNFSNTPGTACLLKPDGRCDEPNRLRNNFIVAPGEFILVSDDKGGVMRASGTSFAAPLVSGAIALLHDRWPWLSKYPGETVDIILQSAKDLGAPGVDPVYGRGMLDVTASQSPLDFNKLTIYQYTNGKTVEVKAPDVKKAGVQTAWETNGMYFYAFEKIGGTQRDFAIPLSTKLVDQTLLTQSGSQEQFQRYIYSRLVNWIKGGAANGGTATFASFADQRAPVHNPYGLNLTLSTASRNPVNGYRSGSMPYQSVIRLANPSDSLAVRVGYGDGATVIGAQPGFGLFSDYDSKSGGVNPLLGFASGDGYANVETRLADGLKLAVGTTQRSLRLKSSSRLSIADRETVAAVGALNAGAQFVSVNYQVSPRLAIAAGYTRLREQNSLLGIQSLDPTDLAGGSKTDGLTLSADLKLSDDLSLSASGTLGNTNQGSATQNLAVGKGGLLSSAAQIGLTKSKLLGHSDMIRLSVSQPVFLEHGSIDFSTVKVIDRETGEIGPVTQSFDISQRRRQFVAEAIYARPFLRGEMSLFGRARIQSGSAPDTMPSLIAGARMSFGL